MTNDFVHLHAHSSYSLSEGLIKADRLAACALAGGMSSVALTDTNNLFGMLQFAEACKKQKIKPIIGCQISVSCGHQEAGDVVLLATNSNGLHNLRILASELYLNPSLKNKVAIDYTKVCEKSDGLIMLTGGVSGALFKSVSSNHLEASQHVSAAFLEAFQNCMFVEIQRTGDKNQLQVESRLLEFAKTNNLPIVAANEVFFEKEIDHSAHDTLICISEKSYKHIENRRRISKEHWFKPPNIMRELFSDMQEACDNTVSIANLCNIFPKPSKPSMPCFVGCKPKEEHDLLIDVAQKGLCNLCADMSDHQYGLYRGRLDFELSVIGKMGFAGYFLIVADFIQWAKQQGIPVGPGRGSGAGSIVAWTTGITDLDPIRWGLLFERFLNPDRVSMPDFDIDFCQNRRDEVIAYVRNKYGHDKVANIITFGQFKPRSCIRDVGRTYGMNFHETSFLSNKVPHIPSRPITLREAINQDKELSNILNSDDNNSIVLKESLKLEGIHKQTGTHAAGVVISKENLLETTALYKDQNSEQISIQYDMKDAEKSGLIKFDFLGLTTLTVIDKALGLLSEQGITIDLSTLPLDDRTTYEMLARGNAGGVFQFESQGMRDVLKQMRPDRLEDLIAAVALYRPGPMANIPAYCQRKHGEPWESPHPDIKDILAETYGIMVYQEQVMQIAQTMAGYSLGAADLLRRAMGKKIRSEMEQQRQIFKDGCAARGIAAAKADEVFDLMAKFADYGFNKSHAAAYALISYRTAWLKCHYPAAFLAACMNMEIGNTDKIVSLREQAELSGIKLMPPDIRFSKQHFTVEGNHIRYGLSAIKGMSDNILINKKINRLEDICDFNLNKKSLEALIKSGALGFTGFNKKVILNHVDNIMKLSKHNKNNLDLFGNYNIITDTNADISIIEDMQYELESLGFYLTGHPLQNFCNKVKRMNLSDSRDLKESSQNKIALAGVITDIVNRITKTGKQMSWIKLSDIHGSFEVTFFEEQLNKFKDILNIGNIIVTYSNIKEFNGLRLNAYDAFSLEDKKIFDIMITLKCDFDIHKIHKLVSSCKMGYSSMCLKIEDNGLIYQISKNLDINEKHIETLRTMNIADIKVKEVL